MSHYTTGEDLAESMTNVHLNDEERKPFSANHNHNNSNRNRQRRGINSHLYGNKSDRGGRGGRGGGRGGRGRGAANGEANNHSNCHTHNDNRGRGESGSHRPHDQENNERSDFPGGRLKYEPSTVRAYTPAPTHLAKPYDPMNHRGDGNKKRNTETFKPSHKPTDMRIRAAFAQDKRGSYTNEITSRDVLVVHGLFGDEGDLSIYNKLVKETNNSGVDFSNIWQLWHGDTHVIADDKKGWKQSCPTFKMVLDRIEQYFDMNIQATRLNWYRDSSEWKPFHHDAAAINPDKAKVQNFTVAVSFGAERDAAFEHATTKTTISMPQPNGTVYTFGKDVNVIWRHGILQVPPDKFHDEGRISVIAWGSVKQTQV